MTNNLIIYDKPSTLEIVIRLCLRSSNAFPKFFKENPDDIILNKKNYNQPSIHERRSETFLKHCIYPKLQKCLGMKLSLKLTTMPMITSATLLKVDSNINT